jgi:hypothetical protein
MEKWRLWFELLQVGPFLHKNASIWKYQALEFAWGHKLPSKINKLHVLGPLQQNHVVVAWILILATFNAGMQFWHQGVESSINARLPMLQLDCAPFHNGRKCILIVHPILLFKTTGYQTPSLIFPCGHLFLA